MSTKVSMDVLKDNLSADAVRIGKEGFNIDLDYSIESIKKVDWILSAIHDDYKKTGKEDGLFGISIEFGAYIIKVIERNFESGNWRRDHEAMGEETFPYEWRGSTIFPYGWCLKRICNGTEDDIWMKFKVFILDKGKQN